MKKIGKNKIIIFALAYLALNIILFAVFNNDNANVSDSNSDNSTEVSENVVYDKDGTVLYDFEDEELISVVEYMNTADYVTFKKTITEATITEEGTTDIKCLQCIVADVDTIKNKDITVDILSTPEGGEPIIDGNRADFKEIFGFDYKDYDNVFAVVMKMAKTQGIGTDLENATYNEFLHTVAQQETYVFNDTDLPIIKEILAQIEYDEIIYSDCQYTITESDAKDGFHLNNISATVKYKSNGETKIRSITLSIGIHFEPIEDPLK